MFYKNLKENDEKNNISFYPNVYIFICKNAICNSKTIFWKPRLWVVRINTDDINKLNHTLDAINNVLKIYPSEGLSVSVVAYSKGVRVLMKKNDKKILSRITSLMQYGVEFISCKNTMDTMGYKKKDFIDEVLFVQAGVAQVIEKVASGYIDVSPY